MTKYYVYRFLNEDNKVIYVGRTMNVASRMTTHFSKRGHLPSGCYEQVKRIDYLTLKTKNDMKIKELYYIGKYMPEFNTQDKYNVSIVTDELSDAWIVFDKTEYESYINEIKNLQSELAEKTGQIESLQNELKTYFEKVNSLSVLNQEKVYELNSLRKSKLLINKLEIPASTDNVSFNTAVKFLLENPDLTFINVVEDKLHYALYNVCGDIVGKVLRDDWELQDTEYIVYSADSQKEFSVLGDTKRKCFNIIELMNCNNWVCAKETFPQCKNEPHYLTFS